MTTPTKPVSEREQFYRDVLITAYEINSCTADWAHARKVERDDDLNILSMEVRDFDGDDPSWKKVTPKDLGRALGKIIRGECEIHESYVKRFAGALAANDAGDIDAYDASAILQVAVIGDVIYG